MWTLKVYMFWNSLKTIVNMTKSSVYYEYIFNINKCLLYLCQQLILSILFFFSVMTQTSVVDTSLVRYIKPDVYQYKDSKFLGKIRGL